MFGTTDFFVSNTATHNTGLLLQVKSLEEQYRQQQQQFEDDMAQKYRELLQTKEMVTNLEKQLKATKVCQLIKIKYCCCAVSSVLF